MSRIAVYAGSFDPPTRGHLDIVRRVQPHFEKIYLVVAINHKKQTFFDALERAQLLSDALAGALPKKSFKVFIHDGLLVDFCKQHGASVLIRGLRALSDFEVELQMSAMNRRLAPGIETFHVMTDEKYSFISSSLIKELAQYGSNLSEWVPENVAKALANKYKNRKTKKS